VSWKQRLFDALSAGAAGASASIGAQAGNQNPAPGQAPVVNWQSVGIVAGLYAITGFLQALAQHPAAQQVPAPNQAVKP